MESEPMTRINIIDNTTPILEDFLKKHLAAKLNMSSYANVTNDEQMVKYNYQNETQLLRMGSERNVLESEFTELRNRMEQLSV